MDRLEILMWTLEPYDFGLDRVLDHLGKGISDAHAAIQEASKCFGADAETYLEAVAGDEMTVVDGLLGASFVVCQGYITRVVSGTIRIVDEVDAGGKSIPGISKQKESLMKAALIDRGQPLMLSNAPFPVTKLRLIESAANYFKHYEEWAFDWDDKSKWVKDSPTLQQEKTMGVIKAVGGDRFNTGLGLRKAAEVLGNNELIHLARYTRILRDWHQDIYDTIKKAI